MHAPASCTPPFSHYPPVAGGTITRYALPTHLHPPPPHALTTPPPHALSSPAPHTPSHPSPQVGEAARRCVMSNAPSTFASIKRLIGRTASADELLALAALEVPYRRAGSGEIMLP